MATFILNLLSVAESCVEQNHMDRAQILQRAILSKVSIPFSMSKYYRHPRCSEDRRHTTM
jgi:hypothetical protein